MASALALQPALEAYQTAQGLLRGRASAALLLLGAALLAMEPLLWLVRGWQEPGHNQFGFVVAAMVLVLGLWSATSGPASHSVGRRGALYLLGISALVRLAGQVLGINMLAALTLTVDVYAIGLLLGLDRRPRALAPGWLAVLFILALPLERVVQRLVGYGLQSLSADGACAGLSLVGAQVECHGLRILLEGQDLLVDLPCSGARTLVLLGASFCLLACLRRPSLLSAIAGMSVLLAGAWLGNVVRLMLLAIGLAWPDRFGGINVMAAPWHELIGLLGLTVGLIPLLIWAASAGPGPESAQGPSAATNSVPKTDQQVPAAHTRLPLPAALAFVVCAILINNLRAQPLDVARAVAATDLPAVLGQHHARRLGLSPAERGYYERYGGGAARAAYGPFSLLTVSTTAPLRHLHAPDVCLRGSGHEVRYVGLEHGSAPSAIYRSVDPEGRAWRVAVSFVSADGDLAASIAEVVWIWLHQPGSRWTMVQRIAPWAHPDANAFDAAVGRAFDFPPDPGTPRRVHLVNV